MGACLSINQFDKYEWINTLETVYAQAETLKKQKEEKIGHITNEIVLSLRQGRPQEDHALHQAKQLIKEYGTQMALQLILSSCYGIHLRLDHIANARKCPEDRTRAVHNLIFATTRGLDIPELKTLKNIFKKEFGKEFVAQASKLLAGNQVDPRLISSLSTENHGLERTLETLNRIARDNNIGWVYAP